MYLAEKKAQPVADGILLDAGVSVRMAFFQIGTSADSQKEPKRLIGRRHVLHRSQKSLQLGSWDERNVSHWG